MRGLAADLPSSDFADWLAPNMDTILQHLNLGETNSRAAELVGDLSDESDVVVYGDYDVDGISSTTLAIEMVLAKRLVCATLYRTDLIRATVCTWMSQRLYQGGNVILS